MDATYGVYVTSTKLDPYMNVDARTMVPTGYVIILHNQFQRCWELTDVFSAIREVFVLVMAVKSTLTSETTSTTSISP
jgi:hypothetical protein